MGSPYSKKIINDKKVISILINQFMDKYQPSGEGGTRSPPATLHRLKNPKWPPGGPKWPTGSGKVTDFGIFGAPINYD